MCKTLYYIGFCTTLYINTLFGQNFDKDGSNNAFSTQDSLNIVYINLESKQQILYNKIDKHINILSHDIYDFCVNNKTSMNSSLHQPFKVQDQIKNCMWSNLNTYCYNQNPMAFIEMMNKLKIREEDWIYANELYKSIIYNKYTP